MSKKKLFLLVLVAVTSFTVGYGVVAKAFPTPYHRGYFYDTYDDPGIAVLPAWGGDTSNCYANGLALPTWIESADQFINFIYCKLHMTDYRSHIGAAFIISTMTGVNNPYPDSAQFDDFAGRVRYAESQGWINWHAPFECRVPNTYYQDNGPGDVAAYGSCGQSSEMITFSRDGSANRYIIKRICANPIGDMAPIPASWSVSGSTTVTDSTPDPGDTPTNITTTPGASLNFVNSLTNNGPSSSYNWYALYGHPNPENYTGQYYNNTSLSGAPVMTRSDPGFLNFDWGGGSPGGGVNADGYSARWTKTEYLPPGNYHFDVVADDGVRLYVDGALIIDAWLDQGPTYYGTYRALTEGNHTITMEYYENGGGATAKMWYSLEVQGGAEAGTFSPGQTKTFPQSVTVPLNAAAGSKICRRILWDWKTSNGVGDFYPQGTWGMGNAACATVRANYNLNPTVTTPGTGYAQEGDTIQFNYFVQNTGSDAGTTQCYVQNQSGAAVTVPGLTCVASQNFPAGGPAVPVGTENFPIPAGTTPGTRICRTFFVQPASQSVANRASPQLCVTIAKSPYVHFMGGDVWAGGGFTQADGSCITNATARITTLSRTLPSGGGPAGSTVEYAAFALGRMSLFGSASRAKLASDGLGASSRSLSFANTQALDPGAFASSSHCIEDYAARYETATALAPGTYNLNTSSRTVHVPGNLTITGTLPAGSQQVYLADGDVTISDDIFYLGASPSYASLDAMPSLVVIAKGNIFVSTNAEQLSGIFVARNTFYTCHPKPAVLTTSGDCSPQLVVNGAVKAGRVDLYRTFGASGASPAERKRPAEQFNFSPEMFLRNALNNTTSPTIFVNDSRELPPRF